MTKSHASSHTFELIERIGNLLRSDERESGATNGLQPVHLQALWFIARSNRYSDTPGALAEYLGVTRGTVSSTIKVLRNRGLVNYRKDADDARVTRLSLSEDGQRIQREYLPPASFDGAVRALSATERRGLDEGLEAVLRELQHGSGARAFGVCSSCHHFTRESAGYRCGLTGEPLAEPESELLCRDHLVA